MTATIKLSLEQFLKLPEEDVIYGLITASAIPKVSPKGFHSRLAGTLYILLID